ncbi:hypothetical protein [Bacillus altitudinis]|nr:hypothetical protein [Bacillus altitudinis]
MKEEGGFVDVLNWRRDLGRREFIDKGKGEDEKKSEWRDLK